jgi:hypothetical protein
MIWRQFEQEVMVVIEIRNQEQKQVYNHGWNGIAEDQKQAWASDDSG